MKNQVPSLPTRESHPFPSLQHRFSVRLYLRASAQLTMSANRTKLATFPSKPRIFILTDVLNEPDDSQSLVRYLLYANEFETRGICACTSTWLRSNTHPEELRQIITAYGKVVGNLNSHVHPDFQYQTADVLLDLVTSGPTVSKNDPGIFRQRT